MGKILQIFADLRRNHGRYIDKWWFGYSFCALGLAITIFAFYPGYMSPDSVANLTQGRDGYFYDINSPVMSYFWGILDRLYAGPALMLIFHNLIFWGGCAIFWHSAKGRSAKLAISLVILGFLPQFLSQLSTIWKDVGLAASLFLVASLIYYSVSKNSGVFLFITPVFLFYGYAMRLNAFPAVIPIIIWTGVVIQRIYFPALKKHFKIAFVAGFSVFYFAFLSLGVNFVNKELCEGRTVYPFQQVMIYDLAAISKERREPVFPDYIVNQKNFSLQKVASEYEIRSINSLIYGDRPNFGDAPIITLSSDRTEIEQLRKTWRTGVSNNKLSYLKHRTRVFAQLIGFTRQTVTLPYWDLRFAANTPEYRSEPNLLNNILTKYFSLFRKWGPFNCFIWLSFSLFFIYKSVRRKLIGEWQVVLFLSLSAILYTAAYFPTTPSTEFRYILWSELAAAVSIIFGTFLLVRERRSRLSKNGVS